MMDTKRIVLLLGIFTLAAVAGIAQRPAPKFTSTYTSFQSGCKVIRGHGGTDDAEVCRGPGGYQIRVYSSATMTHIAAELRGTDDSFPVTSVALDFNESKSKAEWRLADGKPFALILRVPKYADRTDNEPGVGKVMGEELLVVGLKGFQDLNTAIDAKTRGANSLAREAADSAYLAKK